MAKLTLRSTDGRTLCVEMLTFKQALVFITLLAIYYDYMHIKLKVLKCVQI